MRVEINPVVAGLNAADDFTFIRLDVPPAFHRNASVPIRAGSRCILFYICDSDGGTAARIITESHVRINIVVEYKTDQEEDRQNNRQPGKANT